MTNNQTERTEIIRTATLVSCVAVLSVLGVAAGASARAAEDPGVQRAGTAVSVPALNVQVRAPQRRWARSQPIEEQAPVTVAEAPTTGRYEGTTVAAAELQEMRGGFFGPSGMTFRFGFDISTSVNGGLTQRLTLPDTLITPDMQSITINRTAANGDTTTETITRANLASAPAEFKEVLNSGATTISTSFASRGIVSAIQNSANNQLIQRSATINLEVIGLRNVLNNNASGRFVSNALAMRSLFGR
jgi:hypothetical protein